MYLSVLAKDRSAALAAPYAALSGIPLALATGVVKTIEPPGLMSGGDFHHEKRSLGVQVEHLIVNSLGNALERRSTCWTRH